MSIELPFQKPGQTFKTEILIQTVQRNVLHDFVYFRKRQLLFNVHVEENIAFI